MIMRTVPWAQLGRNFAKRTVLLLLRQNGATIACSTSSYTILDVMPLSPELLSFGERAFAVGYAGG